MAVQLIKHKKITKYDTSNPNFDPKKFEEANFARMKGQVARNEARAAEIGYYAQAGTSLMKAYG